MDVELETVGSRRQSAIERNDGVFRAQLAATAMREDQGTRRPERRIHGAILSPFAAAGGRRDEPEASGPRKTHVPIVPSRSWG